MGRGTMVVVALLALVVSIIAQQYTSVKVHQYDVIQLSDVIANLRSIQGTYEEIGVYNDVYVVGDQLYNLDLINFVVKETNFNLSHTFIDVEMFTDAGGNLCAMGPIIPGNAFMNYYGYAIPIALEVILSPGVESSSVGPLLPNYSPYALAATFENNTYPVAYFVGWVPTNGTDPTIGLDFAVMRVQIDTANPDNPYKYNPAVDLLPLSVNSYSSFSKDFKPEIVLSTRAPEMFIIDPISDYIYKIDITPNQPMELINQRKVPNVVGAIYFEPSNTLYLTSSSSSPGSPGTMYSLNAQTMILSSPVPFSGQETYPRVVVQDAGYLYVAMYGGPHIVKVQISNMQIAGYANLPAELTGVVAGWQADPYIVFATDAQPASVFRINVAEFCPSACPSFFGHCSNGTCICQDGYELSKDGSTCDYTAATKIQERINRDHGAEVAFGVLFGIFFVVAVIGWFSWYKLRKEAYKPILSNNNI